MPINSEKRHISCYDTHRNTTRLTTAKLLSHTKAYRYGLRSLKLGINGVKILLSPIKTQIFSHLIRPSL